MTMQRKKLGSSGEDLACKYLESEKYEIINRNIKLKFGEIDIIAAKGDYVVLVEVKTKTIFDQGRPEEMVDYFKKRKLRLLARSLCQNYPGKNVRIDVIAVDETQARPRINHIINAVGENE